MGSIEETNIYVTTGCMVEGNIAWKCKIQNREKASKYIIGKKWGIQFRP